jgi:large-conductance mechanosensitive channel
MFELHVMQNQWLMLALIGGTALMLTLLLAYPAIWRRRDIESMKETTREADKQGFFAWLNSFMPWILSVIYIATIVFMVVYIIRRAAYPPNW